MSKAEKLHPAERLIEPVTVGGWYQTTHGRFAEVAWENGRTRITRIRSQIPTAEEGEVALKVSEADYEAWKASQS